ncbi:hypothetical protein D0Z07_2904 [Hyphodiscus hymeniophilus]|uniref:Uncharacterized protein n=1 Tax=Hyphodiscus hymeniophilus TaxID=353542 RepID=A0A9P7AYC8_9HELO|nr:hypothetical protein D0Z07_2904 [Hyphodiscus hymeniophilus]
MLRGRYNATEVCATHPDVSEQPLNGSNANPNAATAAAQAFLKNQASNASLSSAAAAAALRSRPTTPTSVADVQTKRTIRRTGSTSSMGSSVAGSVSGSRPTSALQRKGSTGSMTERTFRDQSPSPAVPSALDAPPVPAIPKNIPSIPPKSHRRAASLESPQMRVASPPPNQATGRGSSLGPRSTAQPPRKAGQRITSLSSVQELTGVDRPDSRGSVNFSYPRGCSRPTSPVAQRWLTSPSTSRENPSRFNSPDSQNLIYDANSRRFVPAQQFYAMEYAADQRIQNAANKPVKKKNKVAPQQYTGTHLVDGTIGGRPRGTALDAMGAAATKPPKPAEQALLPAPAPVPAAPVEPIPTTPKKKKKKVVVASDSESDQGPFVPYSSADESDIQSNGFNTRAGALLAKKPSIVHEDREREEEEEAISTVKPGLTKLDTGARPISPAPHSPSAAGRGHGRGQATASAAFAQERQQTRSASQPAPYSPTTPAQAGGLTSSVRVQSVSPARTAHFAPTPDSLLVKHQPPARSISPRKSAMKRSNSPRGPPSPADDVSSDAGLGVDSSEVSNGSALHPDELALPRKKAVRVSFDESNVEVGQAAAPVVTDSPVVQSPQTKKSWFSSIGRSKKKDGSVDDDDEIMKPRPALPSFGSVRARKDNREQVEERALVKPAEPVETTQSLSSPALFTSSTGEIRETPLGQSNDYLVGAVISQDASSKNAANISKSREPLPPQVLSVEGSGYSSDTDSSVSGRTSPVGVAHDMKMGAEDQPTELETDPPTINDESRTPTPTEFGSHIDVPQIAVVQATPVLEHTEMGAWPDVVRMPGGWNGSSASDSGSVNNEPSAVVEHAFTDPTTPATVGIAEPTPSEVQPGAAVLGDIAAENTNAISAIMEEAEESDASVYSDAAEDLSDGDGDGFQSLNAVVESPIVPTAVPGFAIYTPPESPTVRTAKEKAYRSQLSKKSSEPDLDEGWEKAQEYWKGLTVEKKRQLEQEARDEAEAVDDSDSTIEAKPAPKPAPKPKTKRKVAAKRPPAEAPIILQSNPTERTYMIQPGSKAGVDGHTPVMRGSMRPEPQNTIDDTHIRKSMRGPGAMRGSLRNEDGQGKKNRPVSLPAPKAQQAPGKTHVRNLSAASAAAASNAARRDVAPKPAPALRRKGSADSDSSFKRARKSNEGSSMRRSMRGSVDERQQPPLQSSRFSIRSLSPAGSTRRPFSAGGAPTSSQTHMRNSLRSAAGPAPSMRAPKPEKSGLFQGFSLSSSTKPSPKPARPSSSRFADSSDEEDARPAFRSRFDDSDDSDNGMPAPRTGGFGAGTMRANAAVRGIPKRGGVQDGDSSDLADSDDEKKFPPGLKISKNNQNGSAPITGAQGTTLASGSLRRSGSGGKRLVVQRLRQCFMSILRRKKPDPTTKVRKSDAESAARRDTPLERSRSDLAFIKRQESYTSATAFGPSSPKLQKKPPSWPLVGDTAPQINGGDDARPFTADGSNGANGTTNGDTARPGLGTRRFTATGLGEVDLNGEKPRKKKKFGALRKMFRLDD